MNPFDQFDAPKANPFDQFDQPKQMKLGMNSFKDALREELKGKDWITRNIIGAGTALSDIYQGAKQFVGQGDRSQIEANQVIQDEAPVGSLAGSVALAATPFGLVGKGVKGAAATGAVYGALQPVAGEQTAANIAKGKAINTVVGGAAGAAGQKAADVVGEKIAERVAKNQFLRTQNAPRDRLLEMAQREGLVVPPSMVDPSFKNVAVESIGGKIATQQQASTLNEQRFNALARRTLGLADDAELTPDALKAFRAEVAERTYTPVANSGVVQTDNAYQKALDKIASKFVTTEKDFPTGAANPVVEFAEQLKVPQFDAANGIKKVQLLRDEAGEAFAKGEKELGRAKRAAAEALEDQLERHIASFGAGAEAKDLLQNFREGRKLLAKSYTVEKALTPGSNAVDTRKFAADLRRGKPLSDELRLMGEFANTFPKAAQPGAQVQGPGVSALNAAMGTVLGTGGAFATGGPGILAGAIPFVARPAARAYSLSPISQNALRDLYRVGVPTRSLESLLPYAGLSANVAALESLN